MRSPQGISVALLVLLLAGSARTTGDTGDAALETKRLDFSPEVMNIEFVRRPLLLNPKEGLGVCADLKGERRYGQIPFRLPEEDALATDHFLSFMVIYGGKPLPDLLVDLNQDGAIACDESVALVQNPGDSGRAFRTLVLGANGIRPQSRYRLSLPVVLGSPEGDLFGVDLVDVPVARWSLDGRESLWVLFDGNHDGVYDRKFGDGILVDATGSGRLNTDPQAGDFFSYNLPLRLGGATYKVLDVDPEGRHLTLERMRESDAAKLRPLGPGETSETIACADAGGGPVRLGGATGRYQLLDFWFSQCGACGGEIKALAPVIERIGPERLTPVGISLDATQAAYRAFVEAHRPAWPQCFVGSTFWDNPVAVKFGATGPSDLILLDPAGRMVARAHRLAELLPKLDELFPPAPAR
jgi:hypothetical protein